MDYYPILGDVAIYSKSFCPKNPDLSSETGEPPGLVNAFD